MVISIKLVYSYTYIYIYNTCVLTIILSTKTAAHFQKRTFCPSLSLQTNAFYFTDRSGTGKHCSKGGATLNYNIYSSSYWAIQISKHVT